MAEEIPEPNYDILDRRISVAMEKQAKTLASAVTETGSGSGGMGGSGLTDITGRLGKVEGALEGFKHSQNMLGVVGGILAAALLGFMVILYARVDSLANKVDDLPKDIKAELTTLTQTLSQAITAARSSDGRQQPIIIQIPPTTATEAKP